MSKPEIIAEGKTKIIWSTDQEDRVSIQSKDDITAGDGARHDILESKGVLSTETTCNCFTLLEAKGIRTHFLGRESERRFLARRVEMIPVELVVRRIATGSYLKRHPRTKEGAIFDDLVSEPFYKDDSLHDPLMVWNLNIGKFELHDAKEPMKEDDPYSGYITELEKLAIRLPGDEILDDLGMAKLSDIARRTFIVLEKAWARLDVVLVDLKIECGWTKDGEIVVADVVDNDSWRIWPGGDKAQMRDKQVYRDAEGMTPEKRGAIKKNYAWVAEATRQFLL